MSSFCVSPAPGAAPRSYVCLVCGAPMLEHACRVRCTRCGYFEDCENGLTPPPVEPPPRPEGRP